MMKSPWIALVMVIGCGDDDGGGHVLTREAGVPSEPASWDETIMRNNSDLLEAGRNVFRDDTFGSEQFFGGQLRLHEAIAGITPRQALGLGLKVDVARLPASVIDAIRGGTIDLDSPATTIELLRLDAVVGVKGCFDANQKPGEHRHHLLVLSRNGRRQRDRRRRRTGQGRPRRVPEIPLAETLCCPAAVHGSQR